MNLKDGFNEYAFTVELNQVQYRWKNMLKDKHYRVPFEELKDTIIDNTERRFFLIGFPFIALILFQLLRLGDYGNIVGSIFGYAFFISFPILTALIIFFPRKTVFLQTEKKDVTIVLPNTKSCIRELRNAISQRNEYLRATYFFFDAQAEPRNEINKINWLFYNRVITSEERDQVVNAIMSSFESEKNLRNST